MSAVSNSGRKPSGRRNPPEDGGDGPGREAVWRVEDPPLAAILTWWMANARRLPWRASRDVYAVWVAEVMSAQTTVTRAASAWERWIVRWPTVEHLAGASLTEVLAQWQGLGYPRRARDLHRSARIVAAQGWPEDLTDLPGVGDYIAAAIRCFALEDPVLPLDVNVRRVVRRRLPGAVDISGDPWRAGQAIMEFGQRICTATPRCQDCPARAGCAGPQESGDGPSGRRQPRFEGSLRQRRGHLLRRAIAEGGVTITPADREAATGLAADGLVALIGDRVLPPDAE